MGGVRPQPFCIRSSCSNIVTTGNGAGTKNVLKLNRVLGFVFSILSSVYSITTVAKVSLQYFYPDMVYCEFMLYASVETTSQLCKSHDANKERIVNF